jgi:hypothetical protein
MITTIKNPENSSTSILSLWKHIMTAPENETHKKGKPIVESKEHLNHILRGLENDNVIMISEEDGNIVMI